MVRKLGPRRGDVDGRCGEGPQFPESERPRSDVRRDHLSEGGRLIWVSRPRQAPPSLTAFTQGDLSPVNPGLSTFGASKDRNRQTHYTRKLGGGARVPNAFSSRGERGS